MPQEQAHYLKNVLRKNEGDYVRLFNGRGGEWLCALVNIGKKSALAEPKEQIRVQTTPARAIHAYFAPIKKARMDILIEKAVELGATHLHPVLTQNTEMRKLNVERLSAQIIEAAEQCERLSLPELAPATDIYKALSNLPCPLYAAIERGDYKEARDILPREGDIAILTGPEGGFTEEEITFLLNHKNMTPVSLGKNILRAETALLKLLSLV